MEARAAVACLGAHRRSPEAGERTLVAPKTKQAGPFSSAAPSPETPLVAKPTLEETVLLNSLPLCVVVLEGSLR